MPKPTKRPAVKKPAYLGAADIGELLGVSERTVSNWLREKGLPFKEDRLGRRFVWHDVLAWYVEMKLSEAGNAGKRALNRANVALEAGTGDEIEAVAAAPEDFKKAITRKTIAEADLKELELATKRGEVVAISDVQRALENTANALRSKITGWPTLIVGRVFGVKDRNALFAILTREAASLSRDLMNADLTPVAEEPSAGA